MLDCAHYTCIMQIFNIRKRDELAKNNGLDSSIVYITLGKLYVVTLEKSCYTTWKCCYIRKRYCYIRKKVVTLRYTRLHYKILVHHSEIVILTDDNWKIKTRI